MTPAPRHALDLLLRDEGSIVLLDPLTPEAADWLRALGGDDGALWYCGALVADRRLAPELLERLDADGFKIGVER